MRTRPPRIRAATATVVTAAAGLTAALLATTPADAAPVPVVLPISGTTTLANPLAGGAVLTMPEGARLRGDFDLATSGVTGTMEIPEITAKVRALGLPWIGDTTSTVVLEPIGDTVAVVGDGGIVTADTTFRIALPDVRSDLPLLRLINLGGPTCRTGDVTARLVSSEPFSLTDPIAMSAAFTIGDLHGCPDVLGLPAGDWLLSTLLSGDGNRLDLTVGPISPDPDAPTPTEPTPTEPTPTVPPKPPVVKPPTKVASTTTATTTAVRYGRKARIRVRVRSSRTATGVVRVRKGAKALGSHRLRSGRATVTLRRKSLRVGRHWLTVVYPGSAKVKASKTTVVLRVKKRR
ncbi:Ig-like domain-containing protein [Mumia flava]|uniref:Ig-like domain-containing protein n=1 Tax=Mumia flava TaxID=1348852 RepID=A0A0B2AYE3_9ACTN|nr:Ig-like domain repeat protein [Mumia flava]PJJ54129.1 Ig-like domain-containing protein [Mumia flava]